MTSLKIKKRLVPVVIYTATHRIEGFYHADDNGHRLLDDLNEQERDFIPLTEVRITKLGHIDGDVVVAKFLALNRQTIALFFPNPKVVSQEGQDDRSAEQSPKLRQRFVESAIVPGLLLGTA
jgi:uncharacterized protein DUF6812